MKLNGEHPFLWDWQPPRRRFRSKLELDWRRFHKKNRAAAREIKARIDAIFKVNRFAWRGSIQKIIEEIRNDPEVKTNKTGDYKFSNNYCAFYARFFNRYVRRYYGPKMFFILHKQKAPCSFGPSNASLPYGGDNSGD